MATRTPFTMYSPYETPDRQRRQTLIRNLTLAISYASPVVFLPAGYMMLTMPSWQSMTSFGLGVLLLVLSMVSRAMNQRGQSEAAVTIMVTYLLIMGSFNALLIEGLLPATAASSIVIVLIAGMALGVNAGLYTAMGGAALLIVVKWLYFSHLIRPLPNDELIAQLIVTIFQVAALFFTAVLGRLATRDLQQALNNATYHLVQANQQLEQANQHKSQFMARTSHELRTPLNAIIGFTDLALREIYGSLNPMQRDGFKRVLGNARRLLALINDILDLSRIEAGELSLVEDEFLVSKLIDTLDVTFRPAAITKNLQLSIILSKAMPTHIVGDENRLTQILTNLVDNAIKYTDFGEVIVRVEPQDNNQRWRIQVQDTGQGILEADFDTIFDEFQRVGEASEDPDRKGTGLGLSITRQLTELMGGEIRVQSQIGEGSTFEVILPLSTPLSTHTRLPIPDQEQHLQ